MNPKEKDDEIIELTDEELDEIFVDDDFDNGEEDGEIRSFYFSNPDPHSRSNRAQRGAVIKIQIRLNKIKILFNQVEARLDFPQNCGIMSVWQSAQLSGGLDSLFRVSI